MTSESQGISASVKCPYDIGDRCEWRFIDPVWVADPEVWIDAEVLDRRYSSHGWVIRVRMGFGWPSTWTRWIWVDFDGNGWDQFPDRDVRPDEVAEFCRHRLRPLNGARAQGEMDVIARFEDDGNA